MVENTLAMIAGVRKDIVRDGPVVLAVTALMWTTWLTLYGIGWVIVHITAASAG